MARLTELARSESGRTYRHEAWRRSRGIVAVQVTLSGLGAVWSDPRAFARATASHFVHAFRRARGATPVAFRRATS